MYSIKRRMKNVNRTISLLPMISTLVAIILSGCVLWGVISSGINYDETGFAEICEIITEAIRIKINSNQDFDSITKVLNQNGISGRITNGNKVIYETEYEDDSMSTGRYMFMKGVEVKNTIYYIYLYGDGNNDTKAVFNYLVVVLFISIIAVPIIAYIIMNKLVDRYLLEEISEFLEKYESAVDEIKSKNFSYRMEMATVEEFIDATKEFNEMIEFVEETYKLKDEQREKELLMIRDISHDIRGPLTTVLFLNNAIAKENNNIKIEKYLQSVDEKIKDIEKMITKILDRLSIEEYTDAELEVIDLDRVIFEYYNNRRVDLDSKDVYVEIKADTAKIIGNEELCYKILDNLIDNSVKYRISDKSNIHIELVNEEKNKVRLSVTDDGPGVSEENLKKIFDAFYRCDLARNTSLKGNGIGLSIVETAVRKMNGTVIAKNVNGLCVEMYFVMRDKDE